MDLAMRQGYGACALPLCGGGRLLLRRSETDQFLFFFSIFIIFIVFSCVLFVFSFMASPRSARTDALFTVREPPDLRLDARRALAADESFAVSRSVTLGPWCPRFAGVCVADALSRVCPHIPCWPGRGGERPS